MFKQLLAVLAFFFAFNSLGQQQHEALGNWIMYFGQNRITDRLSIHSEIQYRNHKAVPIHIEQLLLRTGVNVHFGKNTFGTVGYGFIASHDYESPETEAESTEHRIWQQFIATQQMPHLKFEHRYRLEQRWVNSDYKNRFRYRLMMFIPLNNKFMEPKTWFLGIYDEIFVNDRQTYFDRNRLYIGAGYNFSKALNLQVGFLHQQTNQLGKRYLQFALTFNPDFRKD